MPTPVGTLWGALYQRQTKVILSVAALNEFELEQPEFSFKNKSPEYTAKFPYGKIPVFEGTDGFKLIEGAPIARYLSSIGTQIDLLGSSPQEAAIVDQWIHFAEHEIGVPANNFTGVVYGYGGPFSLEAIEKNAGRLARALNYLESHLAARPSGYVALDTLTLADFVLAGVIHFASCDSLGSAERAQYPHIFAHYARVTGEERVRQYWGTEEFVEVRVTEPQTFTVS